MARFVSEHGSVLHSPDVGSIGPYEEFDWPDFDPEIHGSGIPGCRRLDGDLEEQRPKRRRSNASVGDDGGPDGSGTDGGADDTSGASTDNAAGAASEENPQ